MQELQVEYFFDLIDFEHKDIFEGVSFVWEVLPRIKEFLKEYSLGRIEVDIPDKNFLENPELITIGEGSVVEPGAYIKGPCVIGKNCQVRNGAYIRGDVIVGDSCVVGHTTEVKNAIFLNGAQAGHFAYVGDSILGAKVNLGAGTKCANLKLDRRNINLSCNGQTFKTGLRKFGAIMGDGVQLGCNTVTNPGTVLGKRVLGLPCVVLSGFKSSRTICR